MRDILAFVVRALGQVPKGIWHYLRRKRGRQGWRVVAEGPPGVEIVFVVRRNSSAERRLPPKAPRSEGSG
jgi:hypothetical protein